jgi:hypothetical protein
MHRARRRDGRRAEERAGGVAWEDRGRNRASTPIPISRPGPARGLSQPLGVAILEDRNHYKPRPRRQRSWAASGSVRAIAISLLKIRHDHPAHGNPVSLRHPRAATRRGPAGKPRIIARQGKSRQSRIVDHGVRARSGERTPPSQQSGQWGSSSQPRCCGRRDNLSQAIESGRRDRVLRAAMRARLRGGRIARPELVETRPRDRDRPRSR